MQKEGARIDAIAPLLHCTSAAVPVMAPGPLGGGSLP
jgi:hypothetical protein